MAYDLFAPEVITVDGNGSVYALIWGNDTVSNAIHLFSHGGRETVIPIGNNIDITTDKDGNLYMLNHPSNYFLSDITIQKMGLNGTVSTIYTNDRSDFAEKMINSIAVDNNGTIYFSYFNMTQPYYGDPGGLRFIQTYENTSYIASISPNGTINKVYSDNSTPISGTARISVDSNGTIYVGDYSNTIKVIDSKGKVRLI
ncbi:MAG TPA: hypothetical protein VK436_09885, partial [Methanocella sp.]|nr:hypothetical protein [Methanocella sp.]